MALIINRFQSLKKKSVQCQSHLLRTLIFREIMAISHLGLTDVTKVADIEIGASLYNRTQNYRTWL